MKKLKSKVLLALVTIAVLIAPVAYLYAQSTFSAPRVFGRFVASGSGTAPVLSTCGTSPTIVGNDTAGHITIGTGTPAACTMTFNEAFTLVPVCYFNDLTTAGKTNAGTTYKVVPTVSAVVVTFQAATVDGDVIQYSCMGR